jgi:DNA modification methylase
MPQSTQNLFQEAAGGTAILEPSQLNEQMWRAGNLIINGDARVSFRGCPSGVFDAVVTSPPYFGQRDYGIAGQIGMEESVDEYIADLTATLK